MAVHQKPPHGSLEWLTLRHRDEQGRVRFGASDAPALMGCDPFGDIIDLAEDKWFPPEVSEPNAAMMRGNVLEPALVAYAETLLGQKVTTPDLMWSNGRMIATLDGLTEDGTIIVECKTTTAYNSDDGLPNSYYWQCVAQLACHPTATKVLIVVLDKRMRLGSWELERDQEEIDYLLLTADTIGDYLDRRELPPQVKVTERSAKMMWPDPVGVVDIGVEGANLVACINACNRDIKASEERLQRYKDELAALLGSNEVGELDGVKLVTFKKRKGNRRLNMARLVKDFGPLDDYYTEGGSYRVMRTVHSEDDSE